MDATWISLSLVTPSDHHIGIIQHWQHNICNFWNLELPPTFLKNDTDWKGRIVVSHQGQSPSEKVGWNFVPGCFFFWGGEEKIPSHLEAIFGDSKVRLRNQPSNLGLTSWVNEKRPWKVITSAPSQCEDVLTIGRPSWSSKKGCMGSVTNQKLASFGCKIYDRCTRHHYPLDVFGYGSVENQGSFSSFWWSPRGLQMVHLKDWSPKWFWEPKYFWEP